MSKKKKSSVSTASKKRTIRILIFVLIFAVVGFILIQNLYKGECNNGVSEFCYDYFDLFSDYEEESINRTCKEVQSKYSINIYVATSERVMGGATVTGTTFINKNGLTYDDNVVIIILNKAKLDIMTHFDIYTFGTSENKISDKEIDAIVWGDGGDLIIGGYLLEGVTRCVNQCGFAYAWMLTSHASWTNIIIVSFVIALIVGIIVLISIRHNYIKEREVNNYSFSKNTQMNLKVNRDKFVNKIVTQHVIVRDTDSHSSGGGGGHSSGGGGGSGHRGGR